MKSAVIIFVCILGVLALVEFCQAQDNGCDSYDCVVDCFSDGRHGECDSGECRCMQCIYQACRTFCSKQRRIGQCDGESCLCL